MKTINQHKAELWFKIKEIIEQYPNAVIDISTHDGGSVDIIEADIKYDELEIDIYENTIIRVSKPTSN